MMIDIRISRRLPGFTLDASFASDSGITALFGRSGSGKTTLINAIAGLVRPDDGVITVNGVCLFDRARRIDVPRLIRRERGDAGRLRIAGLRAIELDHARVELEWTSTDAAGRIHAWGLPAAHIDCRWGENETRMVRHMQERMQAVVACAGGSSLRTLWWIAATGRSSIMAVGGCASHSVADAESNISAAAGLRPAASSAAITAAIPSSPRSSSTIASTAEPDPARQALAAPALSAAAKIFGSAWYRLMRYG